MVFCGVAVAEFQAAATVAGDLGDDAFDVGPVLAVLLAQFGLVSPVAAGLTEQVVSSVSRNFSAIAGSEFSDPAALVNSRR